MSSEEEIICSRCNNPTEETLVLTCEHNLCLSCAAKLLNAQRITNYSSTKFIKCDKCKIFTELEPETIKQILEQGNQKIEENNKEKGLINNNNEYMNTDELNNVFNNNSDNNQSPTKLNKNINNNKNIENNNISTSEMNIINELSQNNIKQMCKEHLEPLTYLCLDCMSNCICAECVVHGIHKNHEVLNIKKAYPLIFKKLEDLCKYANDQKKSIFLVNETITKKKNLVNTLIDRCKNEIHNTFEQIKMRLENKEKEIINNTTSLLYNNIEELNNFEIELQKNSSNLEEIVGKINNILKKKDELNTINYFCENNDKIIKQCESNEINNLPDLDNFTNIKIEPNVFTLNNMLEGINNFNFDIKTLKGFENNNRRNNNNNIYKIPKNRTKKPNNIIMNNNINQFHNLTNENNNNFNMFNNMQRMNNSNYILNQMPNNNLKNKRPRTAKSNSRRRKMNHNIGQINNNIENYPININDNLNNYPKNINQNIKNYQNNQKSQNFNNIGMYEENNYNFNEDDNNNFN